MAVLGDGQPTKLWAFCPACGDSLAVGTFRIIPARRQDPRPSAVLRLEAVGEIDQPAIDAHVRACKAIA